MTGMRFVKINGHLVNVDSIVEIFPSYNEEKGVHQVLIDIHSTEADEESGDQVPAYLIAWVTKSEEEAGQVAEALARMIGSVVELDPEAVVRDVRKGEKQ